MNEPMHYGENGQMNMESVCSSLALAFELHLSAVFDRVATRHWCGLFADDAIACAFYFESFKRSRVSVCSMSKCLLLTPLVGTWPATDKRFPLIWSNRKTIYFGYVKEFYCFRFQFSNYYYLITSTIDRLKKIFWSNYFVPWVFRSSYLLCLWDV